MFRRERWDGIGRFRRGLSFPSGLRMSISVKRLQDGGLSDRVSSGGGRPHTGAHTRSDICQLEERQLFWYGSLLRYAVKAFAGLASDALLSLGVVLALAFRERFARDDSRSSGCEPVSRYIVE